MSNSAPGQILRRRFLEPLNITATDLAKAMGVSQSVISRIINGKSAITADIALRLELALTPSAETWMNLQTNHDLAMARQKLQETPVEVVRLYGGDMPDAG